MIIQSSFKPHCCFKNRHLQTIWASLFRPYIKISDTQVKRVELDDGDFIDLCIFNSAADSTVLLLHGLEGSLNSHYIQGLVAQLVRQDYRVIVKHFRSCSGENNRLLKSYHSGSSDDLEIIIQFLQQQRLGVDFIVGFSLGGNVLLKWMGELGEKARIKAAVAVSVPLLLEECSNAINQGVSKIYQYYLLNSLKRKYLDKYNLHSHSLPLSVSEIKSIKSFWQFDQLLTAPVNHFESVDDYYQKSSSRQFLKKIRRPCLIIHAKDDPFMNEKVIPRESELSSSITFELSEKGGHVGFIEGTWPWKAEYYLERRIPEFLGNFR
ncbi:hydrolase [Aliikangiella sp. G2MR2-5]|uniref:hydrolase n=1 Tax=Aliikangiella sp. G2MR2-5 TaxID=2788943 RepID=UPI002110FD53|nr:hydrolase [Aliikangiella sp. G2MR2-5]